MTRNGTTRRDLLRTSAVLAPIATASLSGACAYPARATGRAALIPLSPPARGKIAVAFPVSVGAVLIDLVGPWEVFLNASMVGADRSMDMSGERGFAPYTVAETGAPVETYGGMRITPDYTFETAPPPKLIVIPAQSGDTDAMIGWIRKASKSADLTMSICTGAFVLAKTGLLSGKAATTHHGSYADLAMRYSDIHVKRGFRFVDEGQVASSGGLTCGVDLAFHVVERYFGRPIATQTALNMEYQGKGWMDVTGADNAAYTLAPSGRACIVCGMPVGAHSVLTSRYKGRAYYFCSTGHRDLFDKAPDAVLRLAATT